MRLRIIYIRGFSKTLLGLSILINNKQQMVTQLSDPDMPQFRNIPTYFTNNMITLKKKITSIQIFAILWPYFLTIERS